ncbi:MAG TPA: hypothetical protein VE078_09215 [Thermoanaerobaculia bacterium]|nr:hypothetical protein [Thermoanaerobaculia bacterium]
MSFILRIFFSGLIAFVPSPDGKELTVLLLNADHGYHVSDGTSLEAHKPLLLTRAGSCAGQCPSEDAAIAQFLFPDKSPQQAGDSLAQAVFGGGAWQLSGSQLSLRKPCSGDPSLQPPLVLQGNVRRTEEGQLQAVPTTPQEREDFSWVADMDRIYPSAGGVKPEVLTEPPSGLIAARLRLRSGKVFTYRLIQIDGKVKPIHFLPMGGEGAEAPYTQALANWIAAEIQIPGDTVEVLEESLGEGSPRRSMTLSPRDGLVEMAVLNLPALYPPSSAGEGSTEGPPQPGKHFELYFELTKTPPTKQTRPVPQALARSVAGSEPEVAWSALHPREELWSDLLDKIRLGIGRGPYDRVICPMVSFSGQSN